MLASTATSYFCMRTWLSYSDRRRREGEHSSQRYSAHPARPIFPEQFVTCPYRVLGASMFVRTRTLLRYLGPCVYPPQLLKSRTPQNSCRFGCSRYQSCATQYYPYYRALYDSCNVRKWQNKCTLIEYEPICTGHYDAFHFYV
jgi:hypothetical protein